MTFLFMDTYITHREVHVESSEDTVDHTDNVMCITRSGQAMTLFLKVKQYFDVSMNYYTL